MLERLQNPKHNSFENMVYYFVLSQFFRFFSFVLLMMLLLLHFKLG